MEMDKIYMKRAVELAAQGAGFTAPNPLVGAVLVSPAISGDDSKIIGEGFHEKFGSSHAEVNAFLDAESHGNPTCGATLYVTLEPCSHMGKTPPCVNEVIRRGIKRVVIGMIDPNPLVSGSGIKVLEENGIEVTVGVLEEECRRLNEPFIKYITTGLPYLLLKIAMTLDGKIATYVGDSKWISCEDSRNYVHQMRGRYTAIMVGSGTIKTDNPELTARIRGAHQPIRIVVDSRSSIPLEAKVFSVTPEARTILVTSNLADKEKILTLERRGVIVLEAELTQNKQISLTKLMRQLGGLGIDSILLEGGGELNSSALSSHLVDRVEFFIAPKIVGGRDAKTPVEGIGVTKMEDAYRLTEMESRKIGSDLLISAKVEYL